MVVSTEGYPYARVSPDGKWIIYYVQRSSKLTNVRLMRIPVAGGTPQLIFTGPVLEYRCARAPATMCAFDEASADGKRRVFRGFDPTNGSIWDLTTFDTEPTAAYKWDLSPDGTSIAITKIGSQHTYLLPLNRLGRREVTWPLSIGSGNWTGFDWASDGTGLFSGHQAPCQTSLYFLALDGTAHLLWEPKSYFQTYGVPSPDGKRIALEAEEIDSNMWQVENFR